MIRFAVLGSVALVGIGIGFAPQCQADPPINPKAHRTPYVLDNEQFAKDIAAATSDDRRRELFAERWRLIQLAVAHHQTICGSTGRTLHNSLRYWNSGETYPDNPRRIIGDLEEPMIAPEPVAEPADAAAVAEENKDDTPERRPRRVRAGNPLGLNDKPKFTIIMGDCLGDVSLEAGSTIHIYGDLNANLKVKGFSEILVAGSVSEESVIETDDSPTIFVGGDLKGEIRNTKSITLWVHGDLTGKIVTGIPMTSINVMGDFTGNITTQEQRGSIFSLEVRGFASYESIQAISPAKYVQFHATIAESNCLWTCP